MLTGWLVGWLADWLWLADLGTLGRFAADLLREAAKVNAFTLALWVVLLWISFEFAFGGVLLRIWFGKVVTVNAFTLARWGLCFGLASKNRQSELFHFGTLGCFTLDLLRETVRVSAFTLGLWVVLLQICCEELPK